MHVQYYIATINLTKLKLDLFIRGEPLSSWYIDYCTCYGRGLVVHPRNYTGQKLS